jgi:hypothetical protein
MRISLMKEHTKFVCQDGHWLCPGCVSLSAGLFNAALTDVLCSGPTQLADLADALEQAQLVRGQVCVRAQLLWPL